MDVLTIGIAGGTGSGKTTITKRIIREFGDNVAILHHDSYYKAHDNMSYEERSKLNYDHPNAFDTDLLLQHVQLLKQGKAVRCPVYDFADHNRSSKTVTVQPARVLVVEGILIFTEPALCREMDVKLFVDTDADVRILRRIVRDVRDRGRSLDSVVNQYLTTVKPMHEQFVEPSKRVADLIIPEGGKNQVAMDIVLERIRGYLNR